MIVIKGIAASPGIAIAKAYVQEDEEIVVNRIELPRELLREEVKRFKAAQKATHRDLDAAILRLEETPLHDQLSLKRLKKRKLLLKDQIAGLERQLDPDIRA